MCNRNSNVCSGVYECFNVRGVVLNGFDRRCCGKRTGRDSGMCFSNCVFGIGEFDCGDDLR